jgi:hypothetical protein
MSNIIPLNADQPQVLHALTRKRAEIAGRVEEAKHALDDLIGELDHVDATIRIFNPAIDIARIKSKRATRAVVLKGEITRPLLGILREAKAPLTPREITLHLLKARGLEPGDKELVTILIKRVRACLREQKLRGLVDCIPMTGAQQAWELA